MTFQYRNGTFFLGKKRGLCSNQTYFGAKQSKFKMMLRNTRPKLATVLCKSNESVIRRNSRISGLFNEKCLRFIHLESSKKIQRIFPLPIVLVHTNFRAASRQFGPNFPAKMHSSRIFLRTFQQKFALFVTFPVNSQQ